MARSRGAKKGYEAESLAKLFVPQAASAEQARGSHQYRAIHRDCEQWRSVKYKKAELRNRDGLSEKLVSALRAAT